jgi:DNA-binding winged helix-turn-helix (wHTH) protein/predicted ATPase
MPIPGRDIFFAPFRLEAESGRFWNGTRELAIRPKTLAVLRHLTEHAGRLVTVADVAHAVWADSHGSALLVKGCVRELRKLLGDDPTAPRYIETMGRRGYRFIAPIDAVSPTSAWAWASSHPDSTFVGRRIELGQLGSWLDVSCTGTRQIVFVSGEPGIGKTTLARHFLASAVAVHDLRVARGQCIALYGLGEPYLPVLQALATLCRGPGGDRALDVLGRYAPTWLAQMTPLLSTADRERLLARVAGTNRERMLHEMCDAVEAFAAERPFILWLDDLQWSDPSTIDLMSSLALRTERARLLVLGTYRPVEVVVSGHPLGAVRRTLLSSGHAHELALPALSGADVGRYLSLRFPANTFPPTLGPMLLDITDGNPLFLASLLDELVARRVLVEEGGTWALGGRVESLGEVFPPSLRHLIERQVESLPDGDQRILEAGSVAGHEFSAGALAAVLGLDADDVDERLQSLTHTANLVSPRGLDSPPGRATSGRHAFAHALHARVLYDRLSPARRAFLHRRLGEAQEAAWGDRSDEIAAELSLHFERGGVAPCAIRYLRVAGENAARRLAGPEAIGHLTRALGLVDHLARRERPLEELRLQMALGLMLMNSRGEAADVDRAYRRAADLSRRIGSRPELYRTLRGLHRMTLIRGDIGRAMTMARKGVAMARNSGDQEERLEAHVALGVTLFYAGRLAPAREALEKGLRLRGDMPSDSPAFRMLDHAIVIRSHLCLLAWLLADEPGMREQLFEMQRHAAASGQPLAIAYSHISAAMLHQLSRDADAVRVDTDALLAVSAEHGFSLLVALARCERGWAQAVGRGQESGVEEIRAGSRQWQEKGAEFLVPYQLALLGEAQAAVGSLHAALATIEQALGVVEQTGERWWQPELLRLRGEMRAGIALEAREAHPFRGRRTAVASVRKAAALARRQGARALVHRARESLDRLT